jgi:hypothetical protein
LDGDAHAIQVSTSVKHAGMSEPWRDFSGCGSRNKRAGGSGGQEQGIELAAREGIWHSSILDNVIVNEREASIVQDPAERKKWRDA